MRCQSPQVSQNVSCRVAEVHASGMCVGGVALAMSADRAIVLGDSLEKFCGATHRADVDLQIEWLARIPSAKERAVFDSGCTWKLYERASGLQFDFYSPAIGPQPYKRLLTDSYFRTAKLQISEESITRLGRTIHPLGYPLDELLIVHRLTQEKAIELHGCGIVRSDGIGNLFVGHSGAGKSTTTRLWTEMEDVEVLSDDRIIVRRDDTEKQVPHRRSAPIRNDNVSHKMRMYGTPWHGEARYASPNSAPLTRIFILEHGQGNVVTPLSPSQAVGELFARAFVPFHRHEYVESALTFLEELVDRVPCYHYAFEPSQTAVERIREFRD